MAAARALAPSLTPGNTTETHNVSGRDNNTYGITVRCSNWDGTLCRQPEILRSGTAGITSTSRRLQREILQAQWCYLATGDTSVSAGARAAIKERRRTTQGSARSALAKGRMLLILRSIACLLLALNGRSTFSNGSAPQQRRRQV